MRPRRAPAAASGTASKTVETPEEFFERFTRRPDVAEIMRRLAEA